MDSKMKDQLNKYWEGETSLEEEEDLKSLLSETIAEFEEEKALFAHFESKKKAELDETFDDELLAKIAALEEPKETKVISFKSFYQQYSRVAAAILVLLVSGMFYINQQQELQPEDTFEDPELAYAEVKKQLLIVSSYLNKGSNTLNELNNLSKATSELEELGNLGQAAEGLELLSEMNVENN